MSIAENAGMSAADTARLSLNATQNYYYAQLEDSIVDSIERGNSFAESFQQTDAFPVDFLIYMENGELAGELAESMDRASRDLQTTAENNLKILGTVGFVCTFLLVAAVIGTVVITMVQKFYLDPINDLLNI
jgi:type II secretory pathway component PulF